MNDQEVMEYMHRYLDKDLSEAETEQLMEHLRQSPASAVMFERLKQLNANLEQLPRVTPPVSIVDSILPRLEREGLWSEPAPQGAGRSRAQSVPKPDRIRKVAYWFGGLAAACIALAVVIPNLPSSTNVADDSAVMLAEQESSGSNAFSLAQSDMAPSDAGEFTVEAMPPGSSERSAADNAAPAAQSEDAAADGMQGLLADAEWIEAKDQYGGTIGISSMPEPNPEPEPNKILSNKEAEDGAPARPPADQPLDPTPVPEDSHSAPADEPGSEAAAEDETDHHSPGTDAEEEEPILSPDRMSLAALRHAEGGRQVVVTDALGNLVLQTEIYDGEVHNLAWSEDSTVVTFDIAGADGIQHVKIDLVRRTVHAE